MMKKKLSLSVLSVLTGSLMSVGLQASSTEPSSNQSEGSFSQSTSQSALHTPSYLGLNPDVNDQAKKDRHDPHEFAKLHFELHGNNEKRPHLMEEEHGKLPEGFDPQSYLERHPDVGEYASSQKMDQQSFAKYHYLKYGKYENRGFKKEVPQEASSGPVTAPSAPAVQSSSKNDDQEGASVSSAPKVVEGDQKIQTPPKEPENASSSDAVSLSAPSNVEEPLSKPSVEKSPSILGGTGVPSSPSDGAPEGRGPSSQKDLLGQLGQSSAAPLASLTKDRPTPSKRPPTRKPRTKAQQAPNQASDTGGESPEMNAAVQQVPSALSPEDGTPSAGTDSFTKGPVDVGSPSTEPSEPTAPPKKVLMGPGPTVTLGDLTKFKKKTPEERKSFIRENMGAYNNLDAKTKSTVQGDIAALLRDGLDPGSAEYKEFKGYQDQLKGANADKPEVSFGKGTLRQVPPAFVKKTDQDGAGSSTDGSKIPSSAPTTSPVAPGTSAPKSSAPSPVQKLGILSRQIDEGKASPEFLNQKRSYIEKDLAAVKKNNSEDPKVMATVSKIEEALRAVQPKPADEGSVHKSSFARPLSTEGDLITPVQFSPATPVTRSFVSTDDGTPTQS